MKGIILAGGSGTRLYPVTRSLCKQLLPVYDKPMIYYPLSILMLAGIREILIISTSQDVPRFQKSLGDGSQLGIKLTFREQPSPDGTAQAISLAEPFIAGQPVALIFGDNFFLGLGLYGLLRRAASLQEGALIFGYRVPDPKNYGVVEIDSQGKALSLVEKPPEPRSPYAVPGLYFFDAQAVDIAKSLKPSSRGEYEITDVNQVYLKKSQLRVEILGPEMKWLDTGSHDTLLEASNQVQAFQKSRGRKVFCIEEIAYRSGFIDREQFAKLADNFVGNGYKSYFTKILEEEQPRPIGELY